MDTVQFFATAAKGTEPALRDELRELGMREVRADRGGVHFAGSPEDGWRACIWSRIAVRVLAWRASFEAPTEDALYEGIHCIDWRHFLTEKKTLAVRASCRSSHLTHSQYIAQKTKDAIVDQMRERFGARPSVDRDDPDVLVFVHLVKDHADVYLDLSGGSLHRRGWRTRIGEAPLKETLAAAVVRISGWDRDKPLVDPMCGAGTIAIEAAAWALDRAPGLGRARFGFERWANFDDAMATRMRALREEARARARPKGPTVLATDSDPGAVTLTRANAADAGVPVDVAVRDIADLAPTDPPGFLVMNPPYGERIETPSVLYERMASAFGRLHGHTVCLLAGTPEIGRPLRAKPVQSLIVFNGPLECRVLVYRIR
jgi:23S rRNA G2445 N2-methylase RlmL